MTNVLATSRSWHESMAERLRERLGEDVHLITSRSDLQVETLRQLQPEYLFFPHWSFMIPPEVFEEFTCVIFHMTDLPFGRGGSPLQNLITRGITETRISALRCVKELDAGPVYMKRPLSLHGSAEEIFLRAGEVIEDMICEIVKTNPEPVAQEGEPTVFTRRKPEQSDIASVGSLKSLYDLIRMLDADGYPHAFLEAGGFRMEFTRAALSEGSIHADVVIREAKDE